MPEPKTSRQLRNDSKKADRTPEQNRLALKRKTRLFYDCQRLRMQSGGRTKVQAEGNEIELATVDILMLEARSNDLFALEQEALRDIKAHLKSMPVWTQILSDKTRFKGIGPTMAAVIISEIDIHKATTASAVWRYSGLATVPCKRCNRCKDEVTLAKGHDAPLYKHTFQRQQKCADAAKLILEEDTYDSAHSERPVKGEKLHYNKFLKSKMVHVMSGCLLKANSPYRSFYDNYKHRMISAGKGRTDGHRHQMSLRYMVKMVLKDIWIDWRTLEGLEVRPSYQEEYLGHSHHAA